ncbi:MAG: LysR family transcriptional regulator [Pigmentiphaga sp.]
MVKKALLGDVSDSEIRLLRIFKAVVECRGLAAAELELNISRSTISRHLKELEERLGLVLCRRGRAGFALTPDGVQVHDSAQRLLEALDTFRTEVRDLHAGMVGTLAVGMFDKIVSNPQARIGQAIRDFRRRAPEVLLDVTVGTLGELEAAVIDGRLQLAILPQHRSSASLDYIDLFGEEMYLYCGRQHPLYGVNPESMDHDDLQDYDYVGLAYHSPNMEATHRFGLRRQASVSDQEAVLALILSGCYIGFLPDHYAAAFVQQRLIERIVHPGAMYEVRFRAVLRRTWRQSRLTATFLETLCTAHGVGMG